MSLLPFTPRDVQIEAVQMILKHPTYLMCDMSSGKTLMTLMAFHELKQKGWKGQLLVFAPLNPLLLTWPAEIKKWFPQYTYLILHGDNKNYHITLANNYDVLLVNDEGIAWWYNCLTTRKYKPRHKYMVALDEASWLKDHTTKRWGYLSNTMPLWSKYRVCLSGTPAPQDMKDLWSQYYLLDGGARLGGNFYAFREAYYDHNPDTYKWTLKPGADKLMWARISDISLRVDAQKDIGLPPIHEVDFPIDLPPKIREQYDELEKEFILSFSDEEIVASRSAAVAFWKLRQVLQGAVYTQRDIMSKTDGSYKFLHLTKQEYVKKWWDQGGRKPTLFIVRFRFEPELFRRVFGSHVPFIGGGVPLPERKRIVQDWNSGGLPALMVHPQSVAYGLNMQYGGSQIMWLSLSALNTYLQLNSRLRRTGQKADRVMVGRVLFRNTVDEIVSINIKRRDNTQKQLFEYIRNKRKLLK